MEPPHEALAAAAAAAEDSCDAKVKDDRLSYPNWYGAVKAYYRDACVRSHRIFLDCRGNCYYGLSSMIPSQHTFLERQGTDYGLSTSQTDQEEFSMAVRACDPDWQAACQQFRERPPDADEELDPVAVRDEILFQNVAGIGTLGFQQVQRTFRLALAFYDQGKNQEVEEEQVDNPPDMTQHALVSSSSDTEHENGIDGREDEQEVDDIDDDDSEYLPSDEGGEEEFECLHDGDEEGCWYYQPNKYGTHGYKNSVIVPLIVLLCLSQIIFAIAMFIGLARIENLIWKSFETLAILAVHKNKAEL